MTNKFWVIRIDDNGNDKYIKPHGSFIEACRHAENLSRKYKCEAYVKESGYHRCPMMAGYKDGDEVFVI